MDCIAVVPARGGSKGVPGKNLKPLAGKPLIGWTIEAAKAVSNVSEVIVSTDDRSIANTALKFGASVPYFRPPELAADNVHAIHVVLHLIDWLEENRGKLPDAIMMILPTAPLRRSWHMRDALRLFAQDPERPVISVYQLTTAMISLRWIEDDRLVPAFPARDLNVQRQDLRPIYGVNGSIYIASPQHLRAFGSYHTENARPFEMDRLYSLDINSHDDFRMAEHMLNAPDFDLDGAHLSGVSNL